MYSYGRVVIDDVVSIPAMYEMGWGVGGGWGYNATGESRLHGRGWY